MEGDVGGSGGGESGQTGGAAPEVAENRSVGDQARERIAKRAGQNGGADKKEGDDQKKSHESSAKEGQDNVRDVAKKAAESAKKKYKVFGEEVEVDPSRYDEYIQKGLAFEKKSGKLSEMEKKFSSLQDAMDRGDRAAVKKLLGDQRFRQFAVDEINDLIEQEEMSPQERAYLERENALKAREAAIKADEKRRLDEQNAELDKHYTKKFDEEFTKAFEENGLPKQARVVGRMAALMRQNLAMFEDPLPAASIAKLVKQEMTGEVKSLLGALDGKQLAEVLGDEIAQRVRQHSISQLRSPLDGNRAGGVTKQAEQPKERPLFGTMEETRPSKEEWRSRLDKIKAGG